MVRRISVKITLSLLLIAALGVYFTWQKGELLENFKNLLEEEAEKTLNRKVNIKNVAGGVFYPITLKGVEVAYREDSDEQLLLAIENIRVNKRLWDLFFIKKQLLESLALKIEGADLYPLGALGPKLEDQRGIIIFSRDKKRLELDLSNRNYHFKGRILEIYDKPSYELGLKITSRLASGYFSIAGSGNNPEITGALNLFGITRITLDDAPKIKEKTIVFDNLYIQDKYLTRGKIDLIEKKGTFSIFLEDQQKLKITARSINDMHFKITADIDHLEINKQDVVSLIESEVKVNKTQENKFKNIEGNIKTNILILNYTPVENIKGSFIWSGGFLKINELSMGDNFLIRGTVSYNAQESVDLNAEINNLKIEDLSRFKAASRDFVFSGTVNSTIDIKGDLRKPKISVRLATSGGRLQDIQFKPTNLLLYGTYPILTVTEGRINREEGYLALDGFIDLRKIKIGRAMEDLVIKSEKETMVWRGWDVVRKEADSEIRLKRAVGDDISLLYKTHIEDGRSSLKRNRDELELKYGISEKRSFKLRLRENEEFIGLENKIKF
jgi:hypothetical protein